MLFVAAPVTERPRVDRLSHLFRACGLDRPIGPAEADAWLLERQAAMREDPPHLTFEIGDGLFVVHIQNLAGQNAMPVPHRFVVLAVIVGELAHVVSEVLTLAEQLLVGPEAYEGPHHHDVPLRELVPVVIRARPQSLLFEAANPRHAHEWAVFREQKIPDDKILIPGMLGTTTNYVEHPELVAERLLRFADIVGRDRILAGSDCGFGTFAGFGPVDPDIAWLKVGALVEGARIASGKLWRH